MKQTALALSHLIADPLPPGRAPDHRLRPHGAPAHAAAAGRGRAGVGPGHEPPPRADARRPPPAPPPRCRAGGPGRDRRRAHRAPRRATARRSSTGRTTAETVRATVGEVDALTRLRRHAELLPARRRPGPGPLRRRGRPAQRRTRLHPGGRPARRVRRGRLPAGPRGPAPLRLSFRGASPPVPDRFSGSTTRLLPGCDPARADGSSTSSNPHGDCAALPRRLGFGRRRGDRARSGPRRRVRSGVANSVVGPLNCVPIRVPNVRSIP